MFTGRIRMRVPGIFAPSEIDTPSLGCIVSTIWFGRTPIEPCWVNARCGTGLSVTAIVQSAIAGIGLASVGIPFAGVLTAVVLLLCIAQLGPLLVLVPAAIWLYATDSPVRAVVLLVVALVAQVLDNVVRPVLIKRGADLSLLLILPGVIGGLLWLGIIGLFVGPVILAVTSALLESWISSSLAEPELDRTPPPIAAGAREAPEPVLHG